ncbi:Hypp7455 [Branchiostoma lanceolatum]|uniref:Hypp7455 protein n=1 Tax=Branchiostoma lanceolatum TaxID=7740 RepID=A0A8J9Z0K3_BRALA|nr:Hypp7455 [Branchiostoma lanceolatum]
MPARTSITRIRASLDLHIVAAESAGTRSACAGPKRTSAFEDLAKAAAARLPHESSRNLEPSCEEDRADTSR